MTSEADAGWRPLREPPRLSLADRFSASSPFSRLAQVHAFALGGDTLVTMALANSLFFSIGLHAARGRVALYLLFTMAPFAVVAPLLGPAIDRTRNGRRTTVIASAAGRSLVCLILANHLGDEFLFPLAFGALVLSKTYLVTKAAFVPAVVRDDRELVEANSRLAVIGVIAGFVAAAPGAILLKFPWIGGGASVLRFAAIVFGGMTALAFRLPRGEAPRAQVAEPTGEQTEPSRAEPTAESRAEPTAELTAAPGDPDGAAETWASETAGRRGLGVPSIVLALTGMATLRALVGFYTFLVAFGLRRAHVASWEYGLVLAISLFGSFLGAALAPQLRRHVNEERILLGALLVLAAAGLLGSRFGGTVHHPGLVALDAVGLVLGAAANASRTAFDAIVQRDAPEAARGRAFARFETEFQLAWVAGGFLPVLLPIPIWLGLALVATASGFAAFTYAGGRQLVAHRGAGQSVD